MSEADEVGLLGSLRSFLSVNSSLWGFSRAVKNRLSPTPTVIGSDFRTAAAALTPKQLEYGSVFEGTDWRTIFTSGYRHAVVDYEEPRIQVGYWLTLYAAERIDELGKQNGIVSIFVLLPTKESAFLNKVKNTKEHVWYEELIRDEDRFRQLMIRYMDKKRLTYVDMTPTLRSMAQQPYFETADGHPNAIGHEAIARRLLPFVGVCKPI